MPALEEKSRNMMDSLLPAFVAFGVLCVAGAIFFPIYLRFFQKPQPNNGRPDYEQRLMTALTNDQWGNHKTADALYQTIIGAASPDKGYPAVFVHSGDKTSLKVRAYIAIGVMRNHRGDNARALAAFRTGAKLEPEDATTQFYLGYGLEKTGRAEAAQAAYKKASSLGHGEVKKDAEAALQNLNSK